jgi:hypothetical protein
MPDEVKPKLDAFTTKVVGDPAKPQDTFLIQGFVGTSSEDKHTRIYTDATLEKYIDVPNKDIVHSEPLPKDQSPLGGSYLWVKKSAEVVSAAAGGERRKAKFLEGPIAAQAAAAGGFAAVPHGGGTQLLVCHPSLIVQTCPSASCPSVACPFTIHSHVCPPVTVLTHCYPSIIIRCPIITEVCPVHTVVCPVQTAAVCPVQTLACPVQSIACGVGPGPVQQQAMAVHQPPVHVVPTKIAACHLPTPSPLHCPTPWQQCHSVNLSCGGGGGGTQSPLFCPSWFGWPEGPC